MCWFYKNLWWKKSIRSNSSPPESYDATEKLLEILGYKIADLIDKRKISKLKNKIKWTSYTSKSF